MQPLFDLGLQYGLSIENINDTDINDLKWIIEQRQKHENELLNNIWRLLRWQAVIILKGFSKEGLKEKDLILPDEEKPKPKQPQDNSKMKDWAAKADNFIKQKSWQEKQ